jgi:NADH-quinone oxidoreductase subunit L
VTVDDKQLRQSGQVEFSAAPGLGYTYRWEAQGVEGGQEFTANDKLTLTLAPGDKKDVTLHVKNAFGSEGTETVSIARPARKGLPPGSRSDQPAPPSPDKLRELLQQRGAPPPGRAAPPPAGGPQQP